MKPQRLPGQPASMHAMRKAAAVLTAEPRDNDAAVEWTSRLRLIERKRRLVSRLEPAHFRRFFGEYCIRATTASFQLEGFSLDPSDVQNAVAPGGAARAFRSRQQQRLRNHAAILRYLEKLLATGRTLHSATALRWYTSIASGLSITGLDEPAAARLEGAVHQLNSPHLRLRPAIQDIARLHCQLLADPLVPSFNGILCRLLLRYHLGRCGLPPVVFDPEKDTAVMHDESKLLTRLLDLVQESYDQLLENRA